MNDIAQTPDFSRLGELIAEVGNALTARRAEREALKRERAKIAGLPKHRADLARELEAYIDAHVELYKQHLVTHIGPHAAKSDRPLPEARNPRDCGLLAERDGASVNRVPLLALLGPVIKPRLAEFVAGLDLPDNDALRQDERKAALADLDGRIAGLDASIGSLEQQATAAGVVVERRRPTDEEVKTAFNGGVPSDPAVRARVIENLERRLNNEPPLEPIPVRAADLPAVVEADTQRRRAL